MWPTSDTWLNVQAINTLFTTLSIILAFAFACKSIAAVPLLFKKKVSVREEFFPGAAEC